MKQQAAEPQSLHRDDLEPVIREIIRAIRGVTYGSVEVLIHNSRVVQIERKEKLRLDRK
jgi:hypothetical protein